MLKQNLWKYSELIPMQKMDIHIWYIHFSDHDAKQLKRHLSAPEIERAFRFKFPKHQQNFIISRALLRIFLAYYCHLRSQEIIFNYNDFGKPQLNHHNICFNLSHSENSAIYAFNYDDDIGIDIEYIDKSLEWESISKRFFSPLEVKQLFAFPARQQKLMFFKTWTHKEAFIKAKGAGLQIPLKSFSVPLDMSHQLLASDVHEDLKKWFFKDLNPNKKYTAALSYQCKEKTMIKHSYIFNTNNQCT